MKCNKLFLYASYVMITPVLFFFTTILDLIMRLLKNEYEKPQKTEKYKHDFSHLNSSLFYKSRKWHNDRMVLNGEQPNAVTYTSLLIMWSKSRLPIAKERILSVGIILDDISIYCILFIFFCLLICYVYFCAYVFLHLMYVFT